MAVGAGLLDKRYGYHAARWRSRVKRDLYSGPLARRMVDPLVSPARLDLEYAAFSSELDALEQMASLRSFLRHVGRPAKVTIASDGSHTAQTIARMRRLCANLEVLPPSTYVSADMPQSLRRFAAENVMGLKLAFAIWLRPQRPTLYADSDVLFFPAASGAIRELVAQSETPHYLLDCKHTADGRVLPDDLADAPPVNAGFWIAPRPLDWSEPLALLEAMSGPFTGRTEQTLLHVAMHRAGANPMDPSRYVLQIDDRFEYRTRRERTPIVLRHYVTGIRHQFWLNFAA